jgi:ubiquinone/menaquinone biosynthesis C-methylase UbiE
MNKTQQLVLDYFNTDSVVHEFTSAVLNIGLWESEKILIEKYFNKKGKIIDIGCGAGRTTFGMFDLGFCNVEGIDISQKMIDSANNLNSIQQANIPFRVCNANSIDKEDGFYNNALWSYNGFMQIPDFNERLRVLNEIYRVLDNGGYFIFTAHDQLDGGKARYNKYWIQKKGHPLLIEYGDILFKQFDAVGYIHKPPNKEVEALIHQSNFELIETQTRSDICNETDDVKNWAIECRFWILQK